MPKLSSFLHLRVYALAAKSVLAGTAVSVPSTYTHVRVCPIDLPVAIAVRARSVVDMAGTVGVATKRNAFVHIPLRTMVWTWLLRISGCACIVPVVSLIWTGWVRVAARSSVACFDGLHGMSYSVVLCIGSMVYTVVVGVVALQSPAISLLCLL